LNPFWAAIQMSEVGGDDVFSGIRRVFSEIDTVYDQACPDCAAIACGNWLKVLPT
jgi:hypothetical protein